MTLRRAFCALWVALLMAFISNQLHAAGAKHWQRSSYQITLQLAVDTSARPEFSLGEALAEFIRQRVDASLTPLWLLQVDLTSGTQCFQLLSGLAPEPWEAIPESIQSQDKLIRLSVQASVDGYQLKCREFDCYTRRWGSVLEQHLKQRGMLAEVCFHLLCDCFAPLARVETILEKPEQVRLLFKGSELATPSNASWFGQVGDRFLPLVRRTDRSGQLLPGGVLDVPWTYLTLCQTGAVVEKRAEPDGQQEEETTEKVLTAPKQEGPTAPVLGRRLCAVHSGLRRPFGIRRHGRNEHLALAIRHRPAPTRVRFYARHDKTRGLAGYEVYLNDARIAGPLLESNKEKSGHRLLGRTDLHGTILVEPGHEPITTLLLISDGQPLAKVPVAPGFTPLLEIPVADDPARLRAQVRLEEIRDELIDLVARRNIFMGRIRYSIKEGKLDQARDLLGQLGELKGRSQFNQILTATDNDQRIHSSDPKVEARIEQMIAGTRTLLGRFLDGKPISELEHEVLTARRGKEAEPKPLDIEDVEAKE